MLEIKKRVIHLSLKPEELLVFEPDWKGSKRLKGETLKKILENTEFEGWDVSHHSIDFTHCPNHIYTIEMNLNLRKNIEIDCHVNKNVRIPCYKCETSGVVETPFPHGYIDETCPECDGVGYFN